MNNGKGSFQVDIAGVVASTGGAIAAVANPEGVPLIITRCVLNRTTKSTGAANADIGVAANATTSADNLLDGVDIGAAENAEDNITNKGSNGKSVKRWAASEYVTVTGSADSSGLVGTLSFEYIRA